MIAIPIILTAVFSAAIAYIYKKMKSQCDTKIKFLQTQHEETLEKYRKTAQNAFLLQKNKADALEKENAALKKEILDLQAQIAEAKENANPAGKAPKKATKKAK